MMEVLVIEGEMMMGKLAQEMLTDDKVMVIQSSYRGHGDEFAPLNLFK